MLQGQAGGGAATASLGSPARRRSGDLLSQLCVEGPRCESQARGAGHQPEPLTRRTGVSLQLKEKHKQSGGGLGALEELENAFSLAEESCPGISDKLMAQLVERVQR